MDSFLERIYLGQAKQECEYCYAALNRFNNALAREAEGDPFTSAMEFVHHAAAVSRMFWPPGPRNKEARQRAQRRGDYLRRTLSIPADHPIKGRTLRDHFQHFDERLDEWAERSKNRNIIGRLLGPRSAIGGDGIEDGDIIHHYDPETKVYAFRGERFDIQELADGISDLYHRISERLTALEPWKAQINPPRT